MQVIVDSNIIFSATLSANSKFSEIIFNPSFELITPQLLADEIYLHLDKILKYSKQTEPETIKYLNLILSRINFYRLDLIPEETILKAYELCKQYDESDTPFIALALHFNAKLWTGDKIKEHLRKLGFNSFFEY